MSPSSAAALPIRQVASRTTAETIDDYLSITMHRLDRAIASAALVDPKGVDIDRAAKLIGPLTETLAGLAMGIAVGAIASGVKRTLGAQVGAQTSTRLAQHVARYEPRRIAPLALADTVAVRSFGGELATRLRSRVAMTIGDARQMLMVIADVVAGAGPIEVRALNRMIALAAEDRAIDERYARDLERGWRAYCAVLGSGELPGATTLWAMWMREMTGARPALTPTADEMMAAGFILHTRIG